MAVCWPEPYGIEEIAPGGRKGGEPEELLRDGARRLPDRLQPAFGVREDEDPEALMPEVLAIFPGEREIHVVFDLPLPDRLRFVPEVHFEKTGCDPSG